MGLYKNINGVLSPIAGRGKAEYGASAVRTGTINSPYTPAWGGSEIAVTFDTPMPDADYEVTFALDSFTAAMEVEVKSGSKTANGFTAIFGRFFQTAVPEGTLSVTYTAFKLYTDNEYNGLLNNQRYSTDEIDTGKTWIDGKKIYRKVVDCGALPNSTTKTVPHGISNLDWVVDLKGISEYNTGITFIILPEPHPASIGSSVQLYVSGDNIAIRDGSDLSGYNNTKVIIEYTKTT